MISIYNITQFFKKANKKTPVSKITGVFIVNLILENYLLNSTCVTIANSLNTINNTTANIYYMINSLNNSINTTLNIITHLLYTCFNLSLKFINSGINFIHFSSNHFAKFFAYFDNSIYTCFSKSKCPLHKFKCYPNSTRYS